MLERFTDSARRRVESARAHAVDATAGEVRPEHLLLALIDGEDCLAVRVLAGLGAAAPEVRESLDRHRLRYVDGLDDDDVEALRAIGIDLDEVVRRIDRNLGGPAVPPGRGGRGSRGRRRRCSSSRCGRRSRCGTTTSAPSTCCSGWRAATTGWSRTRSRRSAWSRSAARRGRRCRPEGRLTVSVRGREVGLLREGGPLPTGGRQFRKRHHWVMSFYEAAASRYDTMEYRFCGRSGLKLPAISLGLWQNFGDDRPEETQRAILRRAFDRGVTHFDLANNYGPPYGRAEDQLRPLPTRGLRRATVTSW